MEDYSGRFTPAPEDPQGVLGVPINCTVIQAEEALRQWAGSLAGVGGLRLTAAREQAVRELKLRRITAAAKMVDAALEERPASRPPDPEEDERRAAAAAAREQNTREKAATQAAQFRDQGRDFLNHPRPLALLERSLRDMGLGGDDLVVSKVVFLAATTRVLSPRLNQQAHVHIVGEASSGKSMETLAALEHLPHETVVRFDGASPKALIYYGGEIAHCVILYSEMDSLPTASDEGDASNTALTYLRTLCSEGVARYSVVQKGENGMETVSFERQGPAVVVVTGTKSIPDKQLASRLHEIEVKVTRARLRAILSAQSASLAGKTRSGPDPTIVAAQAYLQTLAPLDVQVQFAPDLATLFLERVRTNDPRLTRELSRVTGFISAHALLCVDRRRRSPSGAVLADLEDYEAAREVVREMTVSREYGDLALGVWDAVAEVFSTTHRPVEIGDIKRKVLKSRASVSKAVRDLLGGGALEDRRDSRASRTAPHQVVPVGDRPDVVPLPTVEEVTSALAERLSPRAVSSKEGQAHITQQDNLTEQAPGLLKQGNPMKGNALTQPATQQRGVKAGNLKVHRIGDVLPDGRVVAEVDEAGRLLLVKRTPVAEVRL